MSDSPVDNLVPGDTADLCLRIDRLTGVAHRIKRRLDLVEHVCESDSLGLGKGLLIGGWQGAWAGARVPPLVRD